MYNLRTSNTVPPNRYDPGSLSRLGPVEADVAEAQYLGVVVADPGEEMKKKKSRRCIMLVLITSFFAASCALIVAFIAHGPSGSTKNEVTKTADESIGELCKPSNRRKRDSHLECALACEPSECCKRGCIGKEKNVNCASYSVCSDFERTKSGSVTANVTRSCTLETDNPMDLQMCLDACEHGRCCYFPSSSDQSCNGGMKHDRDFCMQYQECSKLDSILPEWFRSYDEEEGKNETQFVINRTCSPLENKQVQDLKRKDIMDCHKVCDDHLCCFTHEDDLNCKGEISDKCDLYKPCEVLMETSKQKYEVENITIQEAISQSKKHCTFPEITHDIGYSTCYSICSPYLCCWSDNNNCNKPGTDVCEQLELCENIMNNTYGDTPKRNENVTINSKIDTICDEGALTTREGIQECHNLCKGHLCCFTDDDQDCTNIHTFECTVYESCANLLIRGGDHNSSSVTHDEVKSACGSIDTEDGLTACIGICADHLCCFQPDHLSSSCQNSSTCENFRACEILVNGDTDPDNLAPVDDTLPHNLTNECDDLSTGAGKSRCASICEQSRCCFLDDAGNCFSTNRDWCESFEKCEDLATSNVDKHYVDGPRSPQYKSDITDLCKKENLIANTTADVKTNLDLCHRICDPFNCCFAGNCSEDVQKDCSEYSGCESLHTYKNPTNTSNLIFNSTHDYLGADVCLPSNYRDDPTKCNELCESSGSKCCFQSGQQSCYVQKLNFCIYSALCEIVYKDQ